MAAYRYHCGTHTNTSVSRGVPTASAGLHYGRVTPGFGVSAGARETVILSAVGPEGIARGGGGVQEDRDADRGGRDDGADANDERDEPGPPAEVDVRGGVGAERRAAPMRAVTAVGTSGAESASAPSRPSARRTRSSGGSASSPRIPQ